MKFEVKYHRIYLQKQTSRNAGTCYQWEYWCKKKMTKGLHVDNRSNLVHNSKSTLPQPHFGTEIFSSNLEFTVRVKGWLNFLRFRKFWYQKTRHLQILECSNQDITFNCSSITSFLEIIANNNKSKDCGSHKSSESFIFWRYFKPQYTWTLCQVHQSLHPWNILKNIYKVK